MLRPNIFDYAPSELSQDAFICWLLAWGSPEFSDVNPELHNLSHALLKSFFEKHNKKFPDVIEKLEIKKQYQNIDILIGINDSFLVPVEDKIYCRERSDQLPRYLSILKNEGHDGQNILPVYLQTGEQGDYKKVKEAGFVPFLRSELLSIIRMGAHFNNDILNDYIAYLEDIERRVRSFTHLALDDWNWYSWQGFYNYLQGRLGDGEWGYVPNASGGFLGFWWYRDGDDDCEQYLQLEENKLCFKIAVEDEVKRTDLKWKWHDKVMEASKEHSANVVKPVLRNGSTMTVAIVAGDYRCADKDGKIDLGKTIEILREAQTIYNKAKNP